MSEEGIPESERLLRNLHPVDFDNGRINSSAFNPSDDHGHRLSVDRSSVFDAKRSFEKFTSRGLQSLGVCGVHHADFLEEDILCLPDKLPDNDAHALADYSPHGTSQRKKKAKRLAKKAAAYGLDFSAV